MSLPTIFQRIEGLILFLIAIYFTFAVKVNWLLFLIILFAIDLSAIGYLINQRIGAIVYNIGHSLIIPLLLLLVWHLTHERSLLVLALIWFAHVGMDRMLGYGLKLPDGFHHTHLGYIGRK